MTFKKITQCKKCFSLYLNFFNMYSNISPQKNVFIRILILYLKFFKCVYLFNICKNMYNMHEKVDTKTSSCVSKINLCIKNVPNVYEKYTMCMKKNWRKPMKIKKQNQKTWRKNNKESHEEDKSSGTYNSASRPSGQLRKLVLQTKNCNRWKESDKSHRKSGHFLSYFSYSLRLGG